jgi:hypothetical protein
MRQGQCGRGPGDGYARPSRRSAGREAADGPRGGPRAIRPAGCGGASGRASTPGPDDGAGRRDGPPATSCGAQGSAPARRGMVPPVAAGGGVRAPQRPAWEGLPGPRGGAVRIRRPGSRAWAVGRVARGAAGSGRASAAATPRPRCGRLRPPRHEAQPPHAAARPPPHTPARRFRAPRRAGSSRRSRWSPERREVRPRSFPPGPVRSIMDALSLRG